MVGVGRWCAFPWIDVFKLEWGVSTTGLLMGMEFGWVGCNGRWYGVTALLFGIRLGWM